MALENTLAKIYKLPQGSANPAPRMMSEQERQMFTDAIPRRGLTRADGLNTMPATPELTNPEMALERIKDIARNVEDPAELQKLLQVINNMSNEINQSKGAISDREMEMFRDATPSMGTMGGGRAPISDQERQMFMDSMPRQTDETQQAIDSLTQELQMTTDPEEAEGLGRMIEKLQVQAMAPMGEMAQQLEQAGGGEDTMIAHLRPGEIVLPPEMMEDPEFESMVETKFNQLGINPAQAVAGVGIASLNESTGLEQFGFFKKIGKSLKKVVKKVAPIAAFIPGVGTALGGVLGGLGSAVTSGLGSIGLGGVGSALGSAGSALAGGIANLGIPGISSIAGGTAGSFGGIGKALTTKAGLFGGGPLAGLLGGGQQPTIEEIGSADPSAQVRIDRLRSEGMSDAQIMQNLQQSGMVPQQAGGSSIFGGGTPGQSRIGMIEDLLKGRPSDPVRQGGMFGSGGQGGGLGGLAGMAGAGALAAGLGKLAYDEAKDAKGVSLSPVVAMDATGRYNLEAEIARRMGQQAPNPVEFGLLPAGTLPELSGGKPREPQPMMYGGSVMPMAYADGGNVAMEDFERKNGFIDGPGTETSDDIPAMLSDGEFVMTGQAVRGAGSFDMNNNQGILTLTPNGGPDRDNGTELMYQLMEAFSGQARPA